MDLGVWFPPKIVRLCVSEDVCVFLENCPACVSAPHPVTAGLDSSPPEDPDEE